MRDALLSGGGAHFDSRIWQKVRRCSPAGRIHYIDAGGVIREILVLAALIGSEERFGVRSVIRNSNTPIDECSPDIRHGTRRAPYHPRVRHPLHQSYCWSAAPAEDDGEIGWIVSRKACLHVNTASARPARAYSFGRG